MSPSVVWAAFGAFFGLVTAICGVVALVLSWQEGNVKDEASKVEADKSRLAIATANQRAAEANERSSEIQAAVAPRRLTKKQQQTIASRLKEFLGQPASLWYGAGDKESETFAQEIGSALGAGNWNVFAPASLVNFSASGAPYASVASLATGVNVSSSEDEPSRAAAQALVGELVTLGFNAVFTKTEKDRSPVVIILVDPRPEGAQGAAKLRAKNK